MNVLAAGRSIVRAPGGRWIVVTTLLLGILAAVAVGAGSPPAERTFVTVSGPAQLLMSVTVPFLGVLLVTRLQRPTRVKSVLSTVTAAVVIALLIAALGGLVCAAVTAAASSTTSAGRWENAGVVAVGSLMVQGLAQLVGTGLGLLLRRPVIACFATIVLPLGLWLVFESIEALRPVQDWTTPYPSAQHLLSGEISATAWAQWVVVLAIWGIALNAFGTAKASQGYVPGETSPAANERPA